MKPFNEWEKIYEDSDFDARMHSTEEDAYGIGIKKTNDLLFFPRGTLSNVGGIYIDRDSAKRTLETLFPNNFIDGKIPDTNLTYDSVIAVATKVSMEKEVNYLHYKIIDLFSKVKKAWGIKE